MRLTKTTDPECPLCRCTQGICLKRTPWFGKVAEKWQCGHCGREFTEMVDAESKPGQPQAPPVDESVRFRHGKTRCPKCGGIETPVTSTREDVRHHKCRACGKCFKSVEN